MIRSDCFAKNIEIEAVDGDVVLSDNYFDMEKGMRTVKIQSGRGCKFELRCLNDLF